jgi:N4-gp56 family major capsid protein
MATTEYGVNHPMAVKHWSADLMKEALKRTQALKFMGKGKDSLCQIKTELNKAAGDRIRFGLRMQLQGDGVAGDGTLEGNEEALSVYTDNVFIDQLRHAVRSEGKMSEQRVPFEVRAEARDGLADWWADRIDSAFFNQIAGYARETDTKRTGSQAALEPDGDHVVFWDTTAGTVHTAEASITAADVFDLNVIDLCIEKATVGNASGPGGPVPIRPLRMGSDQYYCIFLHPYQVYDLRTSTDTGQWLDIQKAAMQGGQITKNPIFTGALGVYNNTIIHESTRLPIGTVSGSAASGAEVRRAVFCGAQAAAVAYGRKSGKNTYSWREELFDYGNQLGVGAGSIWGLKKCRFNGSDHAAITVFTAAASHG